MRARVARLAVALAVGSACGGGSSSDTIDSSGTEGSSGTTQGSTSETESSSDGTTTGVDGSVRLLVFSKTLEYRHESIEDGVAALEQIGADRGWDVEHTEDAAVLVAGLEDHDAVIWLSTSGDVLDDAQQAAFEDYVRSGGGYVGIHSASATEYEWPWYGLLVGAVFDSHPSVQTASVLVEDSDHAATAHLPDPWVRVDEWYNFQSNPRDSVDVLLALDEATYDGGTMMGDHPIAWHHAFEGGRVFYTALGHTSESYVETAFLDHVTGGISWVLTGEQQIVLQEFDGRSPNGEWERMEPSPPDFEFTVTPDELVMVDGGGANQHLVRSGVLIDPARAYAIEVDFTIEGPLTGLNSFAINFNQAGPDGDLSRIDTMAINVDLDEAPEPGGVMKYMGFVDGAFQQIGSRTIDWGLADTEYSIRVEVNRNLAGELVDKMVSVTVSEGTTTLEQFEQDYSSFPYQPPVGEMVRFGLNTHGATWRVRNLTVYYL